MTLSPLKIIGNIVKWCDSVSRIQHTWSNCLQISACGIYTADVHQMLPAGEERRRNKTEAQMGGYG